MNKNTQEDEAAPKKQRWSRAQRREQKERQSVADDATNQTQPHVPKARSRRRKSKPPSLSFKDRMLQCALEAQHTGSVQLVGNDEKFGNEESDTVSDTRLRPPFDGIPVVTTCRPLHTASGTATGEAANPFIFVQPLLILDLNGILCHRIRWHKSVRGTQYRPSVADIANTPIIPRIHLTSFLTYLDAHFTLAVWTSAKAKTAKKLINILIPSPVLERLLFVWSQNKCHQLNPGAKAEDIVFIKSLEEVWKAYPLWDASNTLLMDDSPEKCPMAYQENTLHPPPLNGQQAPEVSLGHDLFGYGTPTPNGLETVSEFLSDEQNEAHQLIFFRELVQYYLKEDGTISRETLMSFLEQYGREFMGWRGTGLTSQVEQGR